MHLKHCDRLRALTTPPGSPFQCLIALSIRKCFLMSSLTFCWHSFVPFPHIPLLGPREKRWRHLLSLPVLRNLCRAMRSPLSLLFSKPEKPTVLNDISQNFHQLCYPPRDTFKNCHILLLWFCFLNHRAQNCTQHSRRGCTNAEYGDNHLSYTGIAVFDASWDALCLPGCQGSLLTHTDLLPTSIPHLSLQDCSPATPFPICTCIQSYPVPHTEPSICFWISCPWCLPNSLFGSLCKASHPSRESKAHPSLVSST